jgi:hypothetical protein
MRYLLNLSRKKRSNGRHWVPGGLEKRLKKYAVLIKHFLGWSKISKLTKIYLYSINPIFKLTLGMNEAQPELTPANIRTN